MTTARPGKKCLAAWVSDAIYDFVMTYGQERGCRNATESLRRLLADVQTGEGSPSRFNSLGRQEEPRVQAAPDPPAAGSHARPRTVNEATPEAEGSQ